LKFSIVSDGVRSQRKRCNLSFLSVHMSRATH
jgi:hypothetical protein